MTHVFALIRYGIAEGSIALFSREADAHSYRKIAKENPNDFYIDGIAVDREDYLSLINRPVHTWLAFARFHAPSLACNDSDITYYAHPCEARTFDPDTWKGGIVPNRETPAEPVYGHDRGFPADDLEIIIDADSLEEAVSTAKTVLAPFVRQRLQERLAMILKNTNALMESIQDDELTSTGQEGGGG